MRDYAPEVSEYRDSDKSMPNKKSSKEKTNGSSEKWEEEDYGYRNS